MVEACFKGVGRALRQALRVEGTRTAEQQGRAVRTARVSDVAIIDNGGANIASLRYALRAARRRVAPDRRPRRAARRATRDPAGRRRGRRRHGPPACAASSSRLIPQLTQPVLGICLGMQLLFASSEEGDDGNDTECLGLIAERVARFPRRPDFPVPHMGWNQLRIAGAASRCSPASATATTSTSCTATRRRIGPWTLATTDYGGEFSAAVRHDNFLGVQFHPERSAQAGRRVLANFLELG